MAFKEALYLGLRLEMPDRVALKGLADHVVKRRIVDQNFAAPFDRFIAIADGRVVYPIAVLHASAHLLGHLSPVLLPFQCALSGHDRLDELAFRRVIKFEVQTFDGRAALPKRLAQVEMEPRVAGKTFEIIKDDDKSLIRLGI